MMKLRKYVSLLLLVVYLTSTAGAAWLSLSCRCVTIIGSHATHATACCGHHDGHGCCAHHGPHSGCAHRSASAHTCTACDAASELHGSWEAPCCDDRHSTEIALYTSDDERILRACAPCTELPAGYEIASQPSAVSTSLAAVERRTPLPDDAYLRGTGLRAPPVLA